MRNRKKIFVDNTSYWIKELTIRNIFSLYYNFKTTEEPHDTKIFGKIFTDFVENRSIVTSITSCPWDKLITLRVSDFKKFYDEFLELNSQFFRREKDKTDGKSRNEDFINNLFMLYCRLVEAGHNNVLDYGYSFFLRAINNNHKIDCEDVAKRATAVRMAHHSNDKDWKRYIRSLIG